MRDLSRRRRSVGRASQDHRRSRMPSPEMSSFFLTMSVKSPEFSDLSEFVRNPLYAGGAHRETISGARFFQHCRLPVRTSGPHFEAAYPPTATGSPHRCRNVAASRSRASHDSTPLCPNAFGCQATFFRHHILWLACVRTLHKSFPRCARATQMFRGKMPIKRCANHYLAEPTGRSMNYSREC